MTQLMCYVRTADKTRKAEIGISPEVTVADLIDTCVNRWSLPTETAYNLVIVDRNIVLSPDQTLIEVGLQEGEILELQPILEAGNESHL
ncbi:MAG: EsaB/YukD family protein [Leptospiraceae bacterium]|nr:EsaB/YukD family protein [Leptospiraceae bacterium]MDW7975738.1 EsaB/YukD family protein [Leptospiraceae bacterium]